MTRAEPWQNHKSVLSMEGNDSSGISYLPDKVVPCRDNYVQGSGSCHTIMGKGYLKQRFEVSGEIRTLQ